MVMSVAVTLVRLVTGASRFLIGLVNLFRGPLLPERLAGNRHRNVGLPHWWKWREWETFSL
jgi:hypothetical protein